MRKQLHIWVSEADYEFITMMAELQGEPVSNVVRRVLRVFRDSYEKRRGRDVPASAGGPVAVDVAREAP